MGFDKDYPNRKDKRKPYLGRNPKRVDGTCRNHGSCRWCANGRQHKHKRRMVEDDGLATD